MTEGDENESEETNDADGDERSFVFEEERIYRNVKMHDVEFYLVEAWVRENNELWFRGYWLALSERSLFSIERDTFMIHFPEDWSLVLLAS